MNLMKKKLVLTGILCLFLLVGCTEKQTTCKSPYTQNGTNCCLDQNNNKVCDSDEMEKAPLKAEIDETQKSIIDKTSDAETNKEQTKEEEPKTKEIEELEDDINEIMKSTYTFKQDKDNQNFVKSNNLKYYVIHKINDSKDYIKNMDDFYKTYYGDNWKDWEYYVNMTQFNWLKPPLTEKDFSRKSEYLDYIKNTAFVNHTITEKTYKLDNGKITEYQFLTWAHDQNDYFLYSYTDSLIMYKIPCSQNLTVFIRPNFQKIQLGVASLKMPELFTNWEYQIEDFRKEILEEADKILQKCQINKDFFESQSPQDYYKSEELSLNWENYYKEYFNMSHSVSAFVEPEDGKYVLRSVNITFKNNEFKLEFPINLKIKILIDGKDEEDYYDSGLATYEFDFNETINKTIDKEKPKIVFSKNLTLEITPYAKYYEIAVIRPWNETINR